MTNPNCPICNEPMEFMYIDANDDDALCDIYECETCQTAKEMVATDYLPDDDGDEEYDYGLGQEH